MIYQYSCKCGKAVDKHRSIAERNKQVKCSCGKLMKRIFTVPIVYINPLPHDFKQRAKKGMDSGYEQRISNEIATGERSGGVF